MTIAAAETGTTPSENGAMTAAAVAAADNTWTWFRNPQAVGTQTYGSIDENKDQINNSKIDEGGRNDLKLNPLLSCLRCL